MRAVAHPAPGQAEHYCTPTPLGTLGITVPTVVVSLLRKAWLENWPFKKKNKLLKCDWHHRSVLFLLTFPVILNQYFCTEEDENVGRKHCAKQTTVAIMIWQKGNIFPIFKLLSFSDQSTRIVMDQDYCHCDIWAGWLSMLLLCWVW